MLYNYYMKNKILSLISLSVFLLLCTFGNAQITVVRIDGKKLYLDTSETKLSIQKGQPFKVILSSEKLTNPKTGKDLGAVYQYSSEGKITEVQPLYAVGELTKTEGISVGQEAVIETNSVQPQSTVAAPGSGQTTDSSRQKIIYEPLEQEIISLTQASVSAPDANDFITLSADRKVTVWREEGENKLKEIFSYSIPKSLEPITISAAPVKEGLAQIFVTAYSPARKKMSTLVLENKNGRLEQTDSLPYFVKEQGCGKEKTIWAQVPFVSEEYPGSARKVVLEEDKLAVSKISFPTQRNWLTGIARYDVEKEGSDNLIYTSSMGTLRIVLQNGKRAESKDLFASSPNRVKYKQEILKFYPSVQVFGPQGDATIAAVENGAKIGLLAQMFGQYQSGKIHFMKYENGSLTVKDTVELDGVIYDTACTDRAVLAVEVLSNGSSRIVEIFK